MIFENTNMTLLHHLKNSSNSLLLPLELVPVACSANAQNGRKKGLQRQHLADLGCLQKMLFNMGEVQ